MTRHIVHHPKVTAPSRPVRTSVPEFDWPGACTCRAFSGGRAVHNYGQPGCRHAETEKS
ncbi:hypothetical protein JOF56_007773 [Kibdelosporangium banguiense]|uniref:SWIM-type domain-containing protein n=1 Tax=Kibdelosporangium banguiense TaxID=1365924 RepID=A0ABS4TSL8_9PSEU|nr:hypothetical protein [Kibdelosporangium banguiense]MBP2327388.1 hypothetical protein [Kibdelosporangium banguiense]